MTLITATCAGRRRQVLQPRPCWKGQEARSGPRGWEDLDRQEGGSSRWRGGMSSEQRAGSRNALGGWRLVWNGAQGAPGARWEPGGGGRGG